MPSQLKGSRRSDEDGGGGGEEEEDGGCCGDMESSPASTPPDSHWDSQVLGGEDQRDLGFFGSLNLNVGWNFFHCLSAGAHVLGLFLVLRSHLVAVRIKNIPEESWIRNQRRFCG